MSPKDLEDLTNALYDEGLTDDEVRAELANVDSSPAPAKAAAQASGKPGLLSFETAFPGLTAAANSIPAGEPAAQQTVPLGGGFGSAPSGGLGAAAKGFVAGASDIAGAGFRLAGSLIPSRVTRGTAEDPTAPMGQRTRTFTESMQNPNGSLLTGLGEDINNSNAPTAVKVAGNVALGAAEGGIVSGAVGAANQTVKNLLAKGAVPVANVAENAAKYVQNVRMGTNTSDIAKGASAGNAMKHGLGNKTLKNALPLAEQKIKGWSEARDAIYKKKAAPEISLESVERDVMEKIDSKAFGATEKTAALDEIRAEVRRFVQANPQSMVNRPGFTPRRSISQLTQDEIQAGVNAGEIKYSARGGKLPFEYAKPEVPPENFLPKEGGVYLNLEQADHLKNWLQDAGANYGKGMTHASPAKQAVYQDVYALVMQRAEDYGGAEYAKLNKNLSEVIPIRNVLARTLGRSELGSDIVDKMGVVKATANAAASVTGVNRYGATAVYNAAQGIKEAAQVPLREAAGQGATEGFRSGILRGSLLGARR